MEAVELVPREVFIAEAQRERERERKQRQCMEGQRGTKGDGCCRGMWQKLEAWRKGL